MLAVIRDFFATERNKTLYLVAIILIHNLIYPLSTMLGVGVIVFYLVFSGMLVLAVFLLSTRRVERWVVSVAGVVVFISGVANSYIPNTLALPSLYVSVIVYMLVTIVVLTRYIFLARRVLAEIIFAAAALYLLIGQAFTPVFGMIEWLQPGSFVASNGAEITWRHLLYYSYVTLTTLGYGDIIPTDYYAQSFAVFEAIIGVLYTVLLLSRLVSVYEQSPPTYIES